jgi:hypothetical protein
MTKPKLGFKIGGSRATLTKLVSSAALAAGLMLLSPSAHAQYYPANSPALRHQFGQFAGGRWWDGTRPDLYAPTWLVYGPYANEIWGENIAVLPMAAVPPWWEPLTYRLDVLEGVTNQILATRDISAPNDSNMPLQAGIFLLPFTVTQGATHSVQVRTRHLSVGTLDQCGLHIMREQGDVVYQQWPGFYSYHEIGARVDGSDWEISAASPECVSPQKCGGKFLTYGPYNKDLVIPTGKDDWYFVVGFHLSLDQVIGNNDRIATADVMVYDSSIGNYRVIASQDIYRNNFTANGVMTVFPMLIHTNRNMSQFQYRVRYWGRGVLRQTRTMVYKTTVPDCLDILPTE